MTAERTAERRGRCAHLTPKPPREIEYFVDRALRNIAHGRFERSLSGLTAFAALVTTAEVYVEHYRASFGNKWMWSPIVVTPPVVIAGIAGVFSRRWATRWLPITAAVYAANGLMGEYFHARGVARRPGGWRLAAGQLQRADGPAHRRAGTASSAGWVCWPRSCGGRSEPQAAGA